MASGVTADMIQAVQRDIYVALARTSESSTLTDGEQDDLLAQACAEACDLLAAWLQSPQWDEVLRVSGEVPIADAVLDLENIKPFLGPLKQTLARIAQRDAAMAAKAGSGDLDDPESYVDQALKAARQTALRHRKLNRQHLFSVAGGRIQSLQVQVCALAGELKSKKNSKEQRAKARSVLKTVGGLLLTLTLGLGSATPQDMGHNLSEWGRDAVQVLIVHNIAEHAQPGVQITPPRLGPRLR